MSLTDDERADAGFLRCIALETPEEVRGAQDRLAWAEDRCALALSSISMLAAEPKASPHGITYWAREYDSAAAVRRTCLHELADGLEAAEALAALRRAEVAA